jgi:CDP-glycerol glycerophosphotransferase
LRTKLATWSIVLLSPVVMVLDRLIPKQPDLWVFGVGRPTQWHGNPQAVYEAVRHRPDVRAVVVAGRVYPAALDPDHDMIVSGWRSLWRLLRAGVIIVHHGKADIPFAGITCNRRLVVNLWHGIPLKGVLYTGWNDIKGQRARTLNAEVRFNSAFIASSAVDRLAMAASTRMPLRDVWVTGLPRNDWLLAPEDMLPPDVRRSLDRLRTELGGRRLVLYAPTFRDSGSGIYSFTDDERTALSRLLASHDAVLGVRTHLNENAVAQLASEPWALDLKPSRYPETQAVLRSTDVLISDYSSIWIDYLLLDRPIIGLTHDLETYRAGRNLLYDIEDVYGGPLVGDGHGLVLELEQALARRPSAESARRRAHARGLFFTHLDAGSTARTVERILQETEGARAS